LDFEKGLEEGDEEEEDLKGNNRKEKGGDSESELDEEIREA
jgi:hypothetical protein